MRLLGIIVASAVVVCGAAERRWHTATCVDAGVKRDARMGAGAADFGPFVRGRIPKGSTPEVATYVIETADERLEIQELEPIGRASLEITIGDQVVFALEKKTAYVKDANGTEHRLLVTKKSAKPKS